MGIIEKNLPPNKHMGYLLIILFISGAIYSFLYASKIIAILLLSLSFILSLITKFNDDLLSPLNKIWMKFGLFISRFMSPIVFGIIFYGLFTPISVITKFFGRDELKLRISDKESYWRDRKAEEDLSERFKLQF